MVLIVFGQLTNLILFCNTFYVTFLFPLETLHILTLGMNTSGLRAGRRSRGSGQPETPKPATWVAALYISHKKCWCLSSKSGGSVWGWGVQGEQRQRHRGCLAPGRWTAAPVKLLLARRLDARAAGQLGKTARGLIPGAPRPVKCEQVTRGVPVHSELPF